MFDLNPAIYGETIIVLKWYAWSIIPLLAALLGAFWIFYDSQRKGTEPKLWKILIVISIVFLIPSVALAVDERIAQNLNQAVSLLAYLGIGAALVSLVAILGYLAKIGYEAVPLSVVAPPGPVPYPPGPLPTPYVPPPTPYAPPGPGGSWGGGMPGHPSLSQDHDFTAISGGVGPVRPSSPPAKTQLLHGPSQQVAYLVIRSGPRNGKEYRLGENTTLGRDGKNSDIILDDQACSSQHARVKLEGHRFVLYDLGSTNGTYLNNKRIDKLALSDGDKITIGQTLLTFMQVKSQG
jgi:hypothetical protein